MPDRHHETQSSAARAEAAEPPPEHRGAEPLRLGSHWVSARMSAQAAPLLPTVEPEPDLAARIEALRVLLASVREEPPAIPNAEKGRGEPSMPKFLRDQLPEGGGQGLVPPPKDEQPQSLNAPRQPFEAAQAPKGGARTPQRRRAPAPWLIVSAATGSIAVLAGLAYLNIPAALLEAPGPQIARAEQSSNVPARGEAKPDPKPAPAAENPPQSPPSFVGTEACAEKPCGAALGTYITRAMAAQPVAAAASAAPGIMVSAPPAALEAAQDALDPLDTVTVRGLPPGARLSVGNRISETEWALALGDLTDLSIIVPEESTEPLNATIEIRRREDHQQLAVFGLTIQRERPAPPVAMSKDAAGEGGNAAAPAKQAKEQAAPPAKPAKAAKAKAPQQPQRAKSSPQSAAAAAQSRGLVQQGAAKAASAAAPPAAKAPAVSLADEPAPPKPVQGPPPGFETLMGLGGGFAVQEQ